MTAIELAAPASLDAAQQQLGEINARIDELTAQRRAALRREPDPVVRQIDSELEECRRVQTVRVDRLQALLEESERATALPVMNGATAPPVPAEPAQPTETVPVTQPDAAEPAPLKIAVPFERSSREIEIASLLVRQNELASKVEMSAADEAEYASNGERIRQLS
jgi:hypothetical protein